MEEINVKKIINQTNACYDYGYTPYRSGIGIGKNFIHSI